MEVVRWIFGLVVILVIALFVVTRVLVSGISQDPLGSFTEVKGEKIHYVDQGKGSAILMIHGASGNLGDMELRLAPALRAAGHRVITVDRPGLGLSSRKAEGLNEITAQAEIMVGLLDALDVQSPTVVGHSLGGSVALAMAVNHSDRVGGLVDISGVSHAWEGDLWWAHSLAGVPVVGWFFCNALMPIVGLALYEASVAGTFAPEAPVPNYSESTQTKMIMRPKTFCNNSSDVRALRDGVRGINAGYAGLTEPFEVVFGTEDYVSPDLHAVGMKAEAPGANVTLIDGAGHMIHHTQFEQVRDLILLAASRNTN